MVKREVKLSLVSIYYITSNYIYMDWTYSIFVVRHFENIFKVKNFVLCLRTFSTQMSTSEFSQCSLHSKLLLNTFITQLIYIIPKTVPYKTLKENFYITE